MAAVKIKTIRPQKLAYLEHKGDYSSIPYGEYFDQLYAWAKEKKVRPGFKPLGIFHDNPDETPKEECRSEIAIPFVGEAEADDEINIKDLPSMEVATIKHKGSSEEYKNTYKTLTDWMAQNNYEFSGPSMEVYSKKPKQKGDEVIIYATIQAPVKKKGQLLRKVVEKEQRTDSQTESTEVENGE